MNTVEIVYKLIKKINEKNSNDFQITIEAYLFRKNTEIILILKIQNILLSLVEKNKCVLQKIITN